MLFLPNVMFERDVVGLRSCAQVSGAATGRPACERANAPAGRGSTRQLC